MNPNFCWIVWFWIDPNHDSIESNRVFEFDPIRPGLISNRSRPASLWFCILVPQGSIRREQRVEEASCKNVGYKAAIFIPISTPPLLSSLSLSPPPLPAVLPFFLPNWFLLLQADSAGSGGNKTRLGRRQLPHLEGRHQCASSCEMDCGETGP